MRMKVEFLDFNSWNFPFRELKDSELGVGRANRSPLALKERSYSHRGFGRKDDLRLCAKAAFRPVPAKLLTFILATVLMTYECPSTA